jgi:hypothetical protein
LDGSDHFPRFGPFWRGGTTHALLEFAISSLQNKEDVIDIRPWVMVSLMPAMGTLLERLIVASFVPFDESFQADVSPDFVPELI